MEHLQHFQLAEDPFRSDPLEKFDTALPSQQGALARLDRGVRQGKGLVLLLGGVGAGKSRVAGRLYEELEEEVFEAGMMMVLRRQHDPAWLLTRFAGQLGVEEPATQHEAIIGQIYERLAIIHEDGRRAVLIIDDAHALASSETLAEVCALVKLEYEDRRLLTVVLAGAPTLDAAVRRDPLLAHHVDVKVHLPPLPRDEAVDYLSARIRTAGGDPQIVLPGAAAALHELSEGAPGRLNVLADNALYEAFVARRNQMTRSDVERAYRDLGWAGVEGGDAEPAPAPRGRRGRSSGDAGQAERAALAEQTMMATASDSEATVRGMAPLGQTDAEVDAVFGPGASGGGMDFEAGPAAARPRGRAQAAPTEVALEREELEGPPKEGDEVDDLFMELLDD